MIEGHPEIGKHGEYEPLCCAVTKQWVQGRHATTYSLGGGYYFRILNKVTKPDTETLKAMRETLQKALPVKAPSKLDK